MANQHSDMAAVDAERAAAWDACRNYAEAARQLGCSRAAVQDSVRRVYGGPVPTPGFAVNRLTTARNADDEVTGTYTQERPDKGDTRADPLPGFAIARRTVHRIGGEVAQVWEQEKPEAVRHWHQIESVLDARIERIPPRPPMANLVPHSAPDLMNQLTIADGHVGAMAWGVETGTDNWDLNLAHSTILAGSMWIIDNLPKADEILINILGDFTDTDGYVPATPASKHILDVDGRFPRIVDVAEDVIEQIVLHALTKHHRVHLVIMPGNHDPLTAMWMRKLFTRIFRDEPRVVVDQSIRNIWCMKFGLNMIAAHHGDKIAMPQLPSVFANDFAPMWGQTVFRYCSTGHLHHKHMVKHVGKQHTGMMVYQHPTISARNAWAAERGYPEARELLGHSYHIRCGMRTTLHFTPEILDVAA